MRLCGTLKAAAEPRASEEEEEEEEESRRGVRNFGARRPTAPPGLKLITVGSAIITLN